LHAKNPADRFDTAEEVAELLEQCLAHLQQPTEFPLPGSLAPKPVPLKDEAAPPGTLWRGGWLIKIAGMIPLCVIVGLMMARRPEPQRTAPLSPGKATTSAAPSTVTASLTVASDDPALDWDVAAQRLEELSRDGEDFQRRVEAPWSDAPASSTRINETFSPSASESQP
jgi:hypothetical protein